MEILIANLKCLDQRPILWSSPALGLLIHALRDTLPDA